MNKPWIGYLASGLLLVSGILEWMGGYPKLGIFLIALSVASFWLRMYFIKKLRGGKDDNH